MYKYMYVVGQKFALAILASNNFFFNSLFNFFFFLACVSSSIYQH